MFWTLIGVATVAYWFVYKLLPIVEGERRGTKI